MKTLAISLPFLLVLAVSTASADILSGLNVHYEFENLGNLGENSAGDDGLADPSLVTTDGPGSLGRAADFGTADEARFIDVFDLAGPGDGPFSFSTWLKTDNSLGVQTLLHGKGATSEDAVVVAIVDGLSSALLIDPESASTNYVAAVDPFDLADGLWHHVAATWTGADDDVLRLYVDGQLAAVETETLGSFDIDAWSIGRQVGGSTYFDGSLDDIRIYDRALDDGDTLLGEAAGGEIAELHAMGQPVPEPGTLVLLASALAGCVVVAMRRRHA